MSAGRDLTEDARAGDYGHPLPAFTRIGRMWAAVLGVETVSPRQVGLCLLAMKVARETYRHKPDNLDDIEGYAHALRLIAEAGEV